MYNKIYCYILKFIKNIILFDFFENFDVVELKTKVEFVIRELSLHMKT